MLRQRAIDDEKLEQPFNMDQFRRLLAYLKPYKKSVIITVLLMFIAAFAGLSGPKLLQVAIDDYMEAGHLVALAIIGILYLVLNLINLLCTRYRVYTMSLVGQKVLYKIRQDMFDHIQKLSFNYYDSRPAGKILVRIINDVNSLGDLLTNGIINVLTDVATLIFVVFFMFSLDVKLALIVMTTMPLMAIVVLGLKNVMRRRWQKVRVKSSSMNAYLHETLAGMKVTQAYTREPETGEIYQELSGEIRSTWLDAVKMNILMGPSIEIIAAIASFLVYFFGIDIVGDVGVLVAFGAYIWRFWQPLSNLANFYNSVLTAMASTERIFELLDTPADIFDHTDAKELPQIQGEVVFENLSFYYEPEKPVLKDINIRVAPGETIALVGPTGAGKSTIVNLISRFYEPVEGRILVDGHDINTVTMDSLRKQMGVMMQDSFIFSGTIMDNIRYGRLNATDEEVMEAARIVHADGFIREMEKGYYTEVNERGSRLSQGQRQLISFARTLLADPRILILDEATSSIDTKTEILVQKGLEQLLKGRTSFVIAHRLSTIRNASRIMVIDDGRIIESGSHDELLELKGAYYKLYRAQYQFLQAV
ncbi:MAG: ABC transporter ATP-binding protein [Caldicoprobacterales bacterium]|jgi:ATP-binding cassette subfamily B multidrug efflux pump|nr:ABC transporter ATP-binding protein [Clostridia bacterium]MDI9513407.1 ABC transporter ATP-binding protein [Bacillota bacterium]